MIENPAVERSLAPDVESPWTNDFILAMRLKGANGTTIAAALVEINDFVRTSGETAEASFGPARQYVESLTLPDLNPKDTTYLMRVAWLTCLGYCGVVMITRSVRPLRDHVLYELSLGAAITLLLVLATNVFIGLNAARILGMMLPHRRRSLFVGVSLMLVWLVLTVYVPGDLNQVIAVVPRGR